MLASLALAVLAYVAGVLVTLSPCTLPLLPIVLSGALSRHRLAPFALASGFVGTFALLTVLVGLLGFAFDVGAEDLRRPAAILMLIVGFLMAWKAASDRLAILGERLLSPVAGRAGRFRPDGLIGHAALGALLSILWSPCGGPALGAALGLAMQADTAVAAIIRLAAFAAGAVTPVLGAAYLSRLFLRRRDVVAGVAHTARIVMGVVLVALGTAVLTGVDKIIEAYLLAQIPTTWLRLVIR